jgi:hypothetical protein
MAKDSTSAAPGKSDQLFRLHQGRSLDARLFAPEFSSGDLRLDSSPKGDPTAALAGLVALAPAAPLLVQLEPETWSAWAPALAALHRPLVVTGSLGGAACEVHQSAAALAGCAALQAHPLFFSDGLLSVMALARQGHFEGLRKFEPYVTMSGQARVYEHAADLGGAEC